MAGATGWVIGLAALGFGLAGGRASLLADEALAPGLEGQDLVLTGVVAAMPQVSEAGLRFRLEVESALWQGRPVTVPPLLELNWYSGLYPGASGLPELQRQPQSLAAGERWRFVARLKAAHGGVNPHGFDYELWLWEQGVRATGSLRTGRNDPPPERLESTWRHPVEAARQHVRERIALALPQRSEGGLIAALVVGDQRAIDRADWDVFRATGVAHLMSISGLHITLFAWLAAGLVNRLWRRSTRLCLAYPAPLAALWCGLALAAAYALFSGWGVPAQRTVLMLAAVTLLRASGRQWPWPVVWLLVCAVVTAADPWALLQPGFWLSFVAVGVLFASSRSPGRSVRDGRLAGAAARVGASAVAMLREQWVITLALTPLTLLLFGQVSLVGLVANALAIPWVTLLVTPLAMLGVLWPPLWSLAALAVQGMTQVLQALAVLPWAVWSTAQAPWWAGVAGMLGGLLLVLRLPPTLRLCGLPLMMPVLLWQPARPLPGEFELLAADIGQGNAVLVRTAHHALLYDAGPRYSRESDAGHRVLVPLLRALDVRLDRLVLSHRDTDHVGGAAAVLAQQPQARLVSTFQDRVDLAGLRQAEPCEAGQRWTWDGVDFEVLHPAARTSDAATTRPNALSCTLRIANARTAALLPGDIEQAQEAALLARGTPLRADLLLVPHHGSKTSSSEPWLDAVQPRIALVQAGYRNRFGHPAPLVVSRYVDRGVRVVDSPHCGAMQWRSQAPDRVHCQREQDPRYWRHRPD